MLKITTVVLTSSIISFILAPTSDCQFFFKRKLEVECTGANIEQLHAIKLKRWDTDKKLLNRFSRWAPLNSFIIFYYGLKLKAELLGSYSGYILKGAVVRYMLNTVPQECWFTTGIYRGLPSSARS